MKILISSDIEGVAGVVHGRQGAAGDPEHEIARRLMAGEVNALVEGAFAGGATEVVVNDAHGHMRNLVPGEIDPRAELVSGWIKPLVMLQGLEDDFDGVILAGYHACAGSFGVLAHAFSGFAFAGIEVGGAAAGEPFFYGALAGSMGVPVILVTGDDRLREEVAPLFPDAGFAEVKRAYGYECARSLSPQAARALLRRKAEAAVRGAPGAAPFRPAPPFRCRLRLTRPNVADLIALLPFCTRVDAVTVEFETAAIGDMVRILTVMAAAGGALR
jgi:D-amino peptidase